MTWAVAPRGRPDGADDRTRPRSAGENKQQSISIEDGQIAGYQVDLLVTFELDD